MAQTPQESPRMLLLSNSANAGAQVFAHAEDAISAFYTGVAEVLFAPWALADHSAYARHIGDAFARLGIRLVSLHTLPDPVGALSSAEGLYVGGGNTFRLLRELYRRELLDPIREASAAACTTAGPARAASSPRRACVPPTTCPSSSPRR